MALLDHVRPGGAHGVEAAEQRHADVALHLVFASRQHHDTYQTHPQHLKFIEENKHLWSSVRVFDSYLAAPAYDRIPDNAKGFAGMLRGIASRAADGSGGDSSRSVSTP